MLALTLAILIPLSLVRDVIHERQRYRAEAVADVVRAYAGPQALAGPVLTVPYTEWANVLEPDAAGAMRSVRKRVTRQWTFFPAQLRVSGPLVPTVRRRGIYEVPLYAWNGDVRAEFDVTLPSDATADAQREIGTPVMSYGIADVRGIRGTPRLQIDGRVTALREGHGVRDTGGLHARLEAPDGARLRYSTQLALDLAGAESLAIFPLGTRNDVRLTSTWPHPSFQGRSPADSRVGAEGFAAQWQLASVATDVQREYLAGHAMQPLPAVDERTLDALGVVLTDPVDAYSQADRATKYGLLFVLLTFVGFFMFELIRALPIHPIQYGLVGLAIAIFFLLLVSLSEHVAFGLAYAIAAFACIGLIAFYLTAVLRSAMRGLGFGAMLALLYAALYGLLISEDNALVLGAGLLFVILAAIMIVTRHVDWYRVAAVPTRTM
ncbi:cell envelope integrity protein CreD [Lysobacter bugurensis]|uniref:Cell envelope integrity protein CreD n=1 Tax=Cognatilysobacter bugurensis TaxID=543356 RepID=A0A918SZ10_9GAMM|nr:cell envelope integrity protein CreD [Lysobacter bugurensis]